MDVAAAADPVAAFLAAHRRGAPVALPTSGSTGRRRRVLRSTASWVDSFLAIARLTGTGPESRVWVPGPLSGTMNLFAAVHARWVGAAPAGAPADATHAHLTPTRLESLLDETPAALDSLTLVVAGDRLSPALHRRAVDAGSRVCHYYGATELSFVAWGAHAEDLRPFPGVQVEVRGGEIWVRSPYLCLGYDGPPGPLRRATDGLVTVGDRGRLEGGRLLVDGRPGAVTTAGATVRIADVEAVLRSSTSGELVVLGVPHPSLGRVLGAVLTSPGDRAALVAAARRHLDPAARPRLWFGLPGLPRTDLGKVDRSAVAEAVAAGRARRLA